MLRIRLTRVGKSHSPHFRVVVADKDAPIKGKFVQIVGHYHPATPGKDFVVDGEKIKGWISKGAKPTDTVWNLLCDHGVIDKSEKRDVKHAKAKPETEKAPEAKPEAPEAEEKVEEAKPETSEAEVVEETPTEETKEEAN